MGLEELASRIVSRNTVIFVGSGFTQDGGGTSWDGLVQFLRHKFQDKSPLTNNFEIIKDIIRDNSYEEVYDAVREKLQGVKVPEKYISLTKLPWYAAFTTNYDTAFEEALDINQNLTVRRIKTGREFKLDGYSSELLCVKLMGCVTSNPADSGHMILDKIDVAISVEERGKIFETLRDYAAYKSFFFFGYSFDDEIFDTILGEITRRNGEPKDTYYAFFPSDPDAQKAYKLNKGNIEFFTGNPEAFVKKLFDAVQKFDPKDFSKKKILIGSKIQIVNSVKIGSFLAKYDPILIEHLEENVEARSFFLGNTTSFKPFQNKWHFVRPEMEKLTSDIRNNKSDYNIFLVAGYHGTGRTFTIMAAINQLIRESRSLAIKIKINPEYRIPSIEEIEYYISEISSICPPDEKPERIILFSDFSLSIGDIHLFERILNECSLPAFLIFEGDLQDKEDLPKLFSGRISVINLIDDLNLQNRTKLMRYLEKTINERKFEPVSEDRLNDIISNEKQFLPIIYRLLYPAKKSIDEIIDSDYSFLTKGDPIIKHCLILCSIPYYFGYSLPLFVLRDTLEDLTKKQILQNEIDECLDHLKSFVIKITDTDSLPRLNMYHEIISRRVIQLIPQKEIDNYYIELSKSLDLTSKKGAEFYGQIFITSGVNLEVYRSKPYSKDGLLKAFEEKSKSQPSRTILHHLARLYERENIKNPKILKLLDQAIISDSKEYELSERLENILTTKANILWKLKKNQLSSYLPDNPEIKRIIDILISAQKSKLPNNHAYKVHATILNDLSKDKPNPQKSELIIDAINVLEKGLGFQSKNNPNDTELLNFLIELLSHLDYSLAKKRANTIFYQNKDGRGYYTLAQIEYYKNNDEIKALEYLTMAISAERVPDLALTLKINIVISSKNPDYKELFRIDELVKKMNIEETWKLAYQRAVIYAVMGHFSSAKRMFGIANQKAINSETKLERYLFWMENGRRKTFQGIILHQSQTVGKISPHNVPNWNEPIFFRPYKQRIGQRLLPGVPVVFELGYNLNGAIAWDIRLKDK
jgi:hypothetical protein